MAGWRKKGVRAGGGGWGMLAWGAHVLSVSRSDPTGRARSGRGGWRVPLRSPSLQPAMGGGGGLAAATSARVR